MVGEKPNLGIVMMQILLISVLPALFYILFIPFFPQHICIHAH